MRSPPNSNPMDRLRLAIDSVVFFFYGLGFFVLGMATAFQHRERSEFNLTKAIWALSGFGVLHAFHEWMLVFTPIQETTLPREGLYLFKLAEVILASASWGLLMQFGILLLRPSERYWRLWRRLPTIALGAWTLALLRLQHLYFTQPVPPDVTLSHLARLDLLGHLWLGLPGALITAWALFRQADQFVETQLQRLVRPLRLAAASFLTYGALVAIAVVDKRFGLVALVISHPNLDLLVLPVQLLQLFTVVAMTLATVRVLAVFNLEGERRLEEAETQRAILNERLRISRDLHDGVMQSIYAVGLSLENVLFLINEDRERASRELERSMVRLNDTIRDIRGYILNLRPARRSTADLYASVLEVVAQFRVGVAIRVSIDLDPLRSVSLSAEQVEEVCQVVREALTNVARHAHASEVAVAAQGGWGKPVEISVWDNGQGFPAGAERLGGRQGLSNMRARAETLGGSLVVNSRRGRGTEIVLRLPFEGGAGDESEHSHRAG